MYLLRYMQRLESESTSISANPSDGASFGYRADAPVPRCLDRRLSHPPPRERHWESHRTLCEVSSAGSDREERTYRNHQRWEQQVPLRTLRKRAS